MGATIEVKCPNCNCDLEIYNDMLLLRNKEMFLIDDSEWYAMNTIDKDKYIVLGYLSESKQHKVIEK
jgi:hypothetical protein